MKKQYEKVKKIDIHIHTAPSEVLAVAPKKATVFANPEELKVMYDKMGIDKGVILPMVNIESMMPNATNEMTYLLVQKYKDMFYWFMNIDPRKANNDPNADLMPYMEHYKSLGAKGVGEICANLYFDDPRTENLFRHCEALDLPLLFHIAPKYGCNYGLADDIGLPRLEKALKKFPKLKFIGHSAPFWAEIGMGFKEEDRDTYPEGKVKEGRIAELMRNYDNLYCDLSAGSGLNAMKRDKEYAVKFLTEFSDRIMFGTDICSPKHTHLYALSEFYDSLLDDELIGYDVYKKICRENAIRILKLD